MKIYLFKFKTMKEITDCYNVLNKLDTLNVLYDIKKFVLDKQSNLDIKNTSEDDFCTLQGKKEILQELEEEINQQIIKLKEK